MVVFLIGLLIYGIIINKVVSNEAGIPLMGGLYGKHRLPPLSGGFYGKRSFAPEFLRNEGFIGFGPLPMDYSMSGKFEKLFRHQQPLQQAVAEDDSSDYDKPEYHELSIPITFRRISLRSLPMSGGFYG